MPAWVAVMLMAAITPPAHPPCDEVQSERATQNAEQQLLKSNYADAARYFEEAFQACPAQHNLLLRLSEADSHAYKGSEAIAAAKRFVELEPSSVHGEVVLANAYFLAQRPVEAQQAADRALQAEPDNAAALKIKGNAQYLAGRTDDAIETFLSLLNQHPEDGDAAYMLGRVYYQEGKVEQATGQFARVLKLDPASYKALDNLGLCYQALGNVDLAKRYFLTAIKVAQDRGASYDWAYANLADLLLQNGDADEAFSAISKAVERNPYSARNFYLGGKALDKIGKIDLSINWLERSASLDSKYPEPLYLLAKLYKERGQDAKAAAALEKFRLVKAAAPRERK